MSLIRLAKPSFRSNFVDSFLDHHWHAADFKNSTFPSVNVHEEDKVFVIELAIPGKTKADFEIKLENDVLCVSSVDSIEKIENTIQFKQREFSYGSFQRQFTLPESIETSKIKAVYTHGILRIVLSKKKEALPQPTKRIAIE